MWYNDEKSGFSRPSMFQNCDFHGLAGRVTPAKHGDLHNKVDEKW